MDPSFLGTWEVDNSKTTGLEEFGKTMGFSEEKIEKYRQLKYALTISLDGDKYKIEIDFKGAVPNTIYEVKLGEEIDYKSIDGYTAKLTLTVEDGKSVESYFYAEKELRWTVTRSVEGDVMNAVTKLGDAVLSQVLNRV
ncbi:uncharacterized protein LOC131942016 [Physella acuta]|uniref:uncharacterized protein LOC131942016 n=1 Tax=Physella acuta TaxID=109671 RepID=UPI0027DB4915|nr:uncharacterized protein LOC131942016 [Physella acuta]